MDSTSGKIFLKNLPFRELLKISRERVKSHAEKELLDEELYLIKIRLLIVAISFVIVIGYYFKGQIQEAYTYFAILVLGIFILLGFRYLLSRFRDKVYVLSFTLIAIESAFITVILSLSAWYRDISGLNLSYAIFGILILLITASSMRGRFFISLVHATALVFSYIVSLGFAVLSGYPLDWSIQIARISILLVATLVSLVLAAKIEVYSSRSVHDFLTGVFNKRYLNEFLKIEVRRARRKGERFIFILLDIDNFKEINDLFGHLTGDLILKRFAEVIKENLRLSDLVARYGGEEFAIVMLDTTVERAWGRVKSIMYKIAIDEKITSLVNKCVTFCAGIAEWPTEGEEVETVIALADCRLLEAKKKGKRSIIGPDDRNYRISTKQMEAIYENVSTKSTPQDFSGIEN